MAYLDQGAATAHASRSSAGAETRDFMSNVDAWSDDDDVMYHDLGLRTRREMAEDDLAELMHEQLLYDNTLQVNYGIEATVGMAGGSDAYHPNLFPTHDAQLRDVDIIYRSWMVVETD